MQRIEERVARIEEWIEEEQGLLDTGIALLLKTLTQGDPSPIEVLQGLGEKASCLSGPIEPPEEAPSLGELLKMLADPEVKRGLYIVLTLLKRLGACNS